MKFYGYMETLEGKAPLGSEGQTLFELETVPGAIRRMRRYATCKFSAKFSNVVRLFSYTNLYDEKTYKQIL